MAETVKEELEESEQSENQFVWDESSQLYYHARAGFYHDPQAGWYYSCKDGLYYKFENGTYVLMEYSQVASPEKNSCVAPAPAESNKYEINADISEDVAQTVEPLSVEFSEGKLVRLPVSAYV
uniref:Uncharacterized protein LOC104239859 n=1 Tax=Nicotiana sylvestris TaxID=4096 RepID=A0A1U7XPS4_NICSY|nr:PREDICTED: uncharacterized protein LOC104239859 [Nicotiana sylvestris]